MALLMLRPAGLPRKYLKGDATQPNYFGSRRQSPLLCTQEIPEHVHGKQHQCHAWQQNTPAQHSPDCYMQLRHSVAIPAGGKFEDVLLMPGLCPDACGR